MEITLIDLSVGDEAEIAGYNTNDEIYRKKILSMGLTRGTTVKLVKLAPLGDPVELLVRGFHLSLRKDEASSLILRRKQS